MLFKKPKHGNKKGVGKVKVAMARILTWLWQAMGNTFAIDSI